MPAWPWSGRLGLLLPAPRLPLCIMFHHATIAGGCFQQPLRKCLPGVLLLSIIMHVSLDCMKQARATTPLRDSEIYLRRLGERVRTLRNQRGMSRKALAQHARVCERYLAQMDAGTGNCSIVLLRRIARVIGLPVTRLVQEAGASPIGIVLLTEFLERIAALVLSEARALMLKQFGGT